jgi:hypothetical protein
MMENILRDITLLYVIVVTLAIGMDDIQIMRNVLLLI